MDTYRILVATLLLCSSLAECPADERNGASDVVRNFIEHAGHSPDGSSAFTIDASAWSGDNRELPIGVFDSGIGGLTVLEAILSMDQFQNENFSPGSDGRRDFEHERFIYFGDQANMPYGNYPSAGREEFLKELILKDAAFLLGRRYWAAAEAQNPSFDKPPVKAIVIACNTATAWGLDEIRQIISGWKIPVIVIGVVEAGARGVLEQSSNDGQPRAVAVLATVGTCGSNAYPKAIGSTMGLAGRRVPMVVQQGSVGLAGAIEGDPAYIVGDNESTELASEDARTRYQGPATGNAVASLNLASMSLYGFDESGLIGDLTKPETLHLNSVSNYVQYDVTELVRKYRDSEPTAMIDTVVLGCTHFPLVEQEILNSFERLRTWEENGRRPFESLIAESIDVVNPAEMTAKELFRELARNNLFRSEDDRKSPGKDQFFMSVANPGCSESQRMPDGSLDRDYKYSRKAGRLQIEDTICVPMQVRILPAPSVNLIRSRLPEVWVRLNPVP